MHGTSRMMWKSVGIVLIYVVPFTLLLANVFPGNLVWFYTLWLVMGLGMVGIGCSIMHDSNHGSYSGNKTLNKLMGKIIAIVGGYEVTWRLQHNVLHHTYTNIEGLDHDIDAGVLLRFSPNSKHYAAHRFQHIYAWFLYGLLTFQWATIKDFKQLVEYDQLGLLKKEKLTLPQALREVTIYKLVYYFLTLVLPLMLSGFAGYHVLIGFFVMHFAAGLSLSAIFQLAHVVGDCEFPVPDQQNKIENSWAIHQLFNTANFAPRSKIMGWFIGGLNHQIEHHLFPYICHIHYKKIAPIVKRTALEFGLPYYEQKTFVHALVAHTRLLKELGNPASL